VRYVLVGQFVGILCGGIDAPKNNFLFLSSLQFAATSTNSLGYG
jgi:hypothetical protein